MRRFDSHQHFWELENPFTDWPTPELAAIYRDYRPKDLGRQLAQCEVDGTILVQAAPSIEESEYCLQIAASHNFVKGVVGWIDFTAADALLQLGRLAVSPYLKGLRPMVQAITEPGWLLKPQFGPVFDAMVERDLSFDALVTATQLADLTAFAARYPRLRIVLDHGGKPPIAKGAKERWSRDIGELATNPNVHCKLSGLWSEAGSNHSEAAIRPWIETLLAAFGSQRLMWGSDWPVVEAVGTYAAWLAQCEAILSHLDTEQRAAVFGGNGRRFYGIP